MLPQSNATITAIRAPTSGEAFDGPQGPGDVKWQGSAPAYLREARDRERTAGGEDRVLRREVIVARGTPPVQAISGDWITVLDDEGAELQARVKTAERRRLAGIPDGLQTTRLTLER